MFISFEGIDGSGKSTQLMLLKDWFEQSGRSVITVREPGATMLSEAIRDILLSNKQTITPTAELLLFNAARTQLVDTVIRPALEEGKVVLCDRFADSTTAYQGYGRMLDLAEVLSCNTLATHGVSPSVTFFIDVPFGEAQQRLQFNQASGEPDRMERSGEEFFNRVRSGYLAIANREPNRFVIIDGLQPRNHIHEQVIEALMERLPQNQG